MAKVLKSRAWYVKLPGEVYANGPVRFDQPVVADAMRAWVRGWLGGQALAPRDSGLADQPRPGSVPLTDWRNVNRPSRDRRIARLRAMIAAEQERTGIEPDDSEWLASLPLAPTVPTEPGQTVALMIARGPAPKSRA